MVTIPAKTNAPASTCYKWKSAQFLCEAPGIRGMAREQFQEKCVAVFRPELRKETA
jgi:hypothetical protein